ncbi:ammonium transporter [Holotrichia oblita]|uniref:Ammonium transporter n=1 Tax=Holotrichia oblita TaxID=644536 RepID=A0ACB9TKK9_HOLOL|nr:ammonium transporter [Holotrichia oblita]
MYTFENETETTPWYYDMSLEDTNWIITSSFMIFTMQTGFGMLESGCVSIKNEVNIMMKNVVDIVLGGLTYWIFGYAFQFGRGPMKNGFMSFGDFCIDPSIDDPMKGAVYSAFIFQLSFATTSTTIVSGAMAESCFNTIIYCIPAGWVWAEDGFLRNLGAVDIAGSGPVHLIGGSAAFAAAIMLGPRLGRYDNGRDPLPLGCPVNAVMGLFVLWWGWLAFNSGSTYGLSGEKWQYAARAAVMTMMSSFGGGCISIVYSLLKNRTFIDVMDIINGILGSLVSITAGCFLYEAWEALLIGTLGAVLVCTAMPAIDMLGIDDPVGASAVHGIGGLWGNVLKILAI